MCDVVLQSAVSVIIAAQLVDWAGLFLPRLLVRLTGRCMVWYGLMSKHALVLE
jgi:hypothetical protein